MKMYRSGRWAFAWVLCCVVGTAFSGPFTQIGLQPFSLTGGTSPNISIAEQEPSVAVIFAPTPAGFAAADQFVKWTTDNGSKVACPKFGIAVLNSDDRPEIVTEALIQRKITIPMFWTSRENAAQYLPQNIHGRVVVLSGGIVNGTSFDALTTAAAQAVALAGGVVTPAQPGTAKEVLPGVVQQVPGVAMPAPTATPTTSATVALRTGNYISTQYEIKVSFPANINWRESRRGDGAVSSSEGTTSKLVWRVWCSPNNVNKDGQAGRMSALEYVRRLITITASRLGTQPTFDKRFEISEGTAIGRDYTYSISPKEGTMVRGRVQAFESGEFIKAVSVEGPAEEFNANNAVIDAFFESFTTQGTPEDLTAGTVPPDGTTPPQNVQPNPSYLQTPNNVPIILPPQAPTTGRPNQSFNSFDFFD